MPEGDALFRFAARLRPALAGKVVTGARAHGPGPVPRIAKIVGATCESVEAVGKNLLIAFDNGLVIRGHLRMYGTWHIYKHGEAWRLPEREARLVLEVDDAVVVNFSAPVVELLEARALAHHAPLAGLGPNLLDGVFDIDEAVARLREPGRQTLTLGDVIMDQRAMAGVGNIWKHETLFRCRLNPWLTLSEIDDDTLRTLVVTARELLEASVGRLVDGLKPRRPTYYVYSRMGLPCRRCHTTLLAARQGQDIRFTTWCPSCQPPREGQAVLPRPSRRARVH